MNFLIDLIPSRARKYLYAVLSFALAVYAIFQAVDGDWREFAVSLATALVTTLATANTDVDLPVVAVDPDALPVNLYEDGYTAAAERHEAAQLTYDDPLAVDQQHRPE